MGWFSLNHFLQLYVDKSVKNFYIFIPYSFINLHNFSYIVPYTNFLLNEKVFRYFGKVYSLLTTTKLEALILRKMHSICCKCLWSLFRKLKCTTFKTPAKFTAYSLSFVRQVRQIEWGCNQMKNIYKTEKT